MITGVGAGGNVVCPAVPVFSTPTATDACGTATITFTDATTAGTCANAYTITRTFTALDGCGNSATATEAFNVTDNTPPVITGVGGGGNVVCPAVCILYTNCNRCMRYGNDHLFGCNNTGSCANAYTITRTFTALDGCGNSATATVTFYVTDNHRL